MKGVAPTTKSVPGLRQRRSITASILLLVIIQVSLIHDPVTAGRRILAGEIPVAPVIRHRDVQVAFVDGNEVALAAGLVPGDTVITDGAAYLDDGERVAVAGN